MNDTNTQSFGGPFFHLLIGTVVDRIAEDDTGKKFHKFEAVDRGDFDIIIDLIFSLFGA